MTNATGTSATCVEPTYKGVLTAIQHLHSKSITCTRNVGSQQKIRETYSRSRSERRL